MRVNERRLTKMPFVPIEATCAPAPAARAAHWSESVNAQTVSFAEIEPNARPKSYKGQVLRQTPTWEPLEPEQAARLRGRPSSYQENFDILVREAMAEGYSLSGFAGRIGLARQTINDWCDKHASFAEACARGKSARLYWWETKALEVAATGGQGSQATMIIFGLKNMGSDEWKEKQEVAHSGAISLSALISDSMKTIEHVPDMIEQSPVVEDATSP